MLDQKWVDEVAAKIKEKELKTAQRNAHKVPYISRDGVYEDLSGERIGWWTNGFWGGILWQMYHATGEQIYKDAAEELEEKLDAALTNCKVMDHDSGFRFMLTAVADYRITGSEASYNRGILAADNLAGRFNPVGRFIQAWNNWDQKEDRSGWAIIDCMMNLPLLYWAGEQTKNPRYSHIAKMHADTSIENFIREDGSSNHIVCFDPETGKYLDTLAGQGCFKGSSWTRGQSWALYGFVFSYLHTKEARYLETAKKVADYWCSCIPESGLIPCDFRQPADCDYEDATAASIAACGLIELAKICGAEGEKYLDAAVTMLKAMDEKRSDWDPARDGILTHCSAAYDGAEHNFHMMYADYYFIEAIWKLSGQEIFLW